jgi:hypothetical protein
MSAFDFRLVISRVSYAPLNRLLASGMVVAFCKVNNMATPSISDPLVAALLEVAKVRFALFREQFGRDPDPDEPLLFDPDQKEPTVATHADGRVQVISAAMASDVDAAAVLTLLGYGVVS